MRFHLSVFRIFSIVCTIALVIAVADCAASPNSGARIVRVEMSDRKLASVTGLAELKLRDAISNLCYRYRYGNNAPRDYEQAFKWCSLGATTLDSNSQVLLAELLWDGYGTAVNKGRALRLYKAAAASEHGYALMKLSLLYRDGNKVAKDAALSAKYLRMAADAGYPEAVTEMAKSDTKYVPAVNLDQKAKDLNPERQEIKISASTGSYVQRYYRTSAAHHWKISMSMIPTHQASTWAPLHSLCVLSEGPSRIFCVGFSRKSLNSDQLIGEVSVLSANQDAKLEQTSLGENYPIDKELKVELETRDQKIFFKINGGAEQVHELGFEPQLLRTLCSTAACTFRLGLSAPERAH